MRFFTAYLWLFVLTVASPFSADSKCERCGTVPVPSNTGFVTLDPILNSPQVWSFVSEPNLHPMKITVLTNLPGTSPGFILVAPYTVSDNTMYGQTCSLMMDNEGNPIWFRPLSSPNLMNTDFRVQKLQGKHVLTFWQGTLATSPAYTNSPAGSSEPGSCFYILDNTYRVIKNVEAQKGYLSDVHEFLLTPQNTALFLSTKKVPMDLTPFGGPQNGFIQDFAIQEVDLRTNKLLFFWNALNHIPLENSFQPASSATETDNIWDAFHLNSVGLTDSKDDILLSSRNCWTIFRINKPTGNIVWQLGGKQSDFSFGPGAEFSWQHDARLLSQNIVSMFDDNCCESNTIPPDTPPAHGLVLLLDFENMTATVDRTYFHDPLLQVATQGNMQSLPNGNKFIGWGQSQYFSEYSNEGNTEENPGLNTLYDAQMPGDNISYRAYRHRWVGKPYYPPSIAAITSNGQSIVYASWNGSTETTAWKVYTGRSPRHLCKVKTVQKTGFETAIDVGNNGPYFKVKALNAQGKVIGESKTVKAN
jgi:hypothetical protein